MTQNIYVGGATHGRSAVLPQGNAGSATERPASASSGTGSIPQSPASAVAYGAPANTGDGRDRVCDKNGAPVLDAPLMVMDIGSLVGRMQAMLERANEARFSSKTSEMYTNTKLRVDSYVAVQREKIADFKARCDELQKRSEVSGFFGWLGKHLGPVLSGLGVVAAGILTFATAGATAGLLAVAVIGFAGSVLSSAGVHLAKSFCGLVTKVLCALDMPKTAAEKWGNLIGGGLMVASLTFLLDPSAVGKLWCGGAELLGADKSTAEKIELAGTVVGMVGTVAISIVATAGVGAVGTVGLHASELVNAARYVSIGSSLVSGVLGVTQAASSMDLAFARYDVDMADSAQKLIQKVLNMARDELAQVQDDIKRGLEDITNNFKQSVDLLGSYIGFLTEQASIPIAA
ncbi:hypothetical protein [Bordetella flabilis]|uniref:Uncharacterized protein n=1 Tax=Bordetella flabilis TaxID=463014 RepID=A0A193GAA6_9BORD|nr:hypothetical protein [Bordetella flabilis]ANN76765.1 hypothetical protein BAU07_06245 [Bordetella flabilis]